MFTVKGWSVDAASLKPQTELFKSSKSQDGEQKKSSKKRKREQLKDEELHDGEEQSKKDRKKERKQKKLEGGSEVEGGVDGHSKSSSRSEHGHKIERWEDIVLGTRKEKLGRSKKSKKQEKKEKRAKESLPKDIESSEASEVELDSSIPHADDDTVANPPTAQESSKLTPMQSAMRQKLISARFRHLNQTLYTEPSSKALELFDQSPDMFEDYHAGFRQQVSVWPENPLDKFIVAIRRRGKTKPPHQFKPYRRKANSKLIHPPKDTGVALPRSSGTSVIADLGCGDARLAHTLTVSGDTTVLNLKIHSFDLHAPNKYVTKADITNIPLKDNSVDVAILCLALMGTNWISFIEEAHRILQWKGELWVAEIKSRFGRASKTGKPVDHSVGKRKQIPTKASEAKAKEQAEDDEREVLQVEVDGVAQNQEETDVSAFISVLRRRGFILKPPSEKAVDLNNKMFVKMEFVKALTPIKGKGKPKGDTIRKPDQKLKFFAEGEEDVDTDDESKVLKPCLYKVR